MSLISTLFNVANNGSHFRETNSNAFSDYAAKLRASEVTNNNNPFLANKDSSESFRGASGRIQAGASALLMPPVSTHHDGTVEPVFSMAF